MKSDRRLLRRELYQAGFTLLEILIVLVIIGILAGLAIPRFVGATSRAKQVEAKQLLRHIYMMQQNYRMEYDTYWIPDHGVKASKDSPMAFMPIGVEIMPQARYEYEITGNQSEFSATATTTSLDDDPTIDKWQIDQTGVLKAISDDTLD